MSNQTKTSNDAAKARRDDESTELGEAAEGVASEARTKATEVKDKVVGESKRAKDEFQDQARGFFDELKEALSDQVGRLSSALRGAERELEEQRLDELATMPRQLADGIDDVGEYVRNRSGSELRRDFENAVTSRPVAVAGGLAVLGAVIAWTLRKDKGSQGVLSGKRSEKGTSRSSTDTAGSEGEEWSRRGSE